jgi:hypothetical protein
MPAKRSTRASSFAKRERFYAKSSRFNIVLLTCVDEKRLSAPGRRRRRPAHQEPREGWNAAGGMLGFSPETISATSRPEPQAMVQPSVPWPVFK